MIRHVRHRVAFALAVAALSTSWALPAYACMGPGFEQYAFLPAPPVAVEDGLVILKVVPPGVIEHRSQLVTVQVVEVVAGEWEGQTAEVYLPNTSCSIRITQAEVPLYLVARLSSVSGRLLAREYRLHQLRGYEDMWDGTVRFNPEEMPATTPAQP